MGVGHDTAHCCSNCNHRVAFKPHNGPIQVIAPRTTGKVVSKYAPVGVMQPTETEKPIQSLPAAQMKNS